jgi:hypothetical protein
MPPSAIYRIELKENRSGAKGQNASIGRIKDEGGVIRYKSQLFATERWGVILFQARCNAVLLWCDSLF